jgi:ubiquitin-protein ligase
MQELAEFEKNSPEWCTVGAVDDDLMHWNAMLAGPVRLFMYLFVWDAAQYV